MTDLRTAHKPKRVYASFRINGANTEPTKITELLKLTPTSTRKKGDWIQVLEKEIEYGLWVFSTKHDFSLHLEHHLLLLIDLLTPKIEVLQSIKDQGNKLSISCYALTEYENVESHVSLPTLRKLSLLPCDFWIDVYFEISDEDDEDENE